MKIKLVENWLNLAPEKVIEHNVWDVLRLLGNHW